MMPRCVIGQKVSVAYMDYSNTKTGDTRGSQAYADNGFVLFGSRDDVEDGKPITYDQLFLFLK